MSDEQIRRVFHTIDSMRLDEFAGLFAEDATLVFGNADPLTGRDAITAGIGEFFAAIKGLRHEIVNAWQVGADTIAETTVTYHRLDDKHVTVPAVSIWHTRDDGLIDDYRIFVDLTPLHAPG